MSYWLRCLGSSQFEFELKLARHFYGDASGSTKAEGRYPFRDVALCLSDFSKIWFGDQTTTLLSRNSRGLASVNPLTLALPLSLRCESFLVLSLSLQFPECRVSSVAGSLDSPCLLSPSGRSLFR
jgi:hypothetical protein